ncbi:MAG TPA: DUF721 domain-containing protein [Bacteroidales bacterium]|jgi:hypothetical protein|nr:DUF721 domain-containing protein [Bacteroidales bacterium]HPI30787.1 DUF721 domain-containing protein [Bacteroidales bacterium]
MQQEKPLKEVIRQLIEYYRLDRKLNEATLIEKWEEIVGKMIAKHTTKLYVDKRVLYVELDSSIVRNELNLIKSEIVKRLNSYFNKPFIDKIILK